MPSFRISKIAARGKGKEVSSPNSISSPPNDRHRISTSEKVEAGEPVRSKLDAILFEEDGGPVNTLLASMGIDDDDDDSDEKKTDSPTSKYFGTSSSNGTADKLNASTGSISSTNSTGSQRSVRFSEGSAPPTDAESMKLLLPMDVDASSPDEMAARVRSLQTRVTQLLLELQAEKSKRKRKEKNLIKLAGEFNARVSELKKKDLQIVKMADIIASKELELDGLQDLHQTSRSLPGLTTKPKPPATPPPQAASVFGSVSGFLGFLLLTAVWLAFAIYVSPIRAKPVPMLVSLTTVHAAPFLASTTTRIKFNFRNLNWENIGQSLRSAFKVMRNKQ